MEIERYLNAMRAQGKADAADLQTHAGELDGTNLNREWYRIPDFQAAKAKMNMLTRSVGFVCKSSAGRIVRLIQPYDSGTYPQEPEELPAQWRFVWSTDPAHALPFVSLATSPYAEGDVCSVDGVVYRSKLANNTWSPVDQPTFWEQV